VQEWNEMHHLQIMESLGGDSLWLDRFMAQHGALVYYWVLIGLLS
jgi:ubiquinol oxidase